MDAVCRTLTVQRSRFGAQQGDIPDQRLHAVRIHAVIDTTQMPLFVEQHKMKRVGLDLPDGLDRLLI